MSDEDLLRGLRGQLQYLEGQRETVARAIEVTEDRIAELERRLAPWPWPTANSMFTRELVRAFSASVVAQFMRPSIFANAVTKDYPR